MGQTTRMVLPYPEGTDTPDVPLDMKELADRLAAIAAGWLPSNTLANRPAPVAGLDRHLFYAHDQGEVSLCVDAGNDGSYAWLRLASFQELTEGLAGKANTVHTHAAGDVNSGTFAIARLPIAASGASSTTAVVRADDSRLSNARTPLAHNHAEGDVTGLTADLAARVKTDRTINAIPVRISRSGKDANSVFTTVSYYRTSDGSLALKSVLSGGSSPTYTTRTVTEYSTDGATVLRTTTYTLSYDADGDLTSEA